jgi:hypothetical protein
VLEDVLIGGRLRPFYEMQTRYEADYRRRLGLG